MVESIPDELLFSHYVGGGRAPFHPKMLLKVILYAYTQKIYSSRKIEQMIHENLPAMWLAGIETPDHCTINDFRGVRMPKMMETVFEQFLLQLVEQGLIDLDHIFVDSTKFEGRKSIENYDQKLRQKIKSLIQEIRQVTLDELEEDRLEDELVSISEELTETVQEIERQHELETDKVQRKELRSKKSELKKKIKTIQTDYLPRLLRYKVQKKILGNRNSYSKTDYDATFMLPNYFFIKAFVNLEVKRLIEEDENVMFHGSS